MAKQFQVPQFIEHESKIVGPFTLKQSAMLGGGGAILMVLWTILDTWLFFIAAFPVTLFVLLGAFIKVNGRPLVDFIGSFISFFVSPQLYIWQKRKERRATKEKKQEIVEKFEGPSVEVTKRGIQDLANKLNQ
jgi:hypothetical protein